MTKEKKAKLNKMRQEVMSKLEEKYPEYTFGAPHFNTRTESLLVVCPTHGKFTSTPAKLLAGQGCKECTKEIRRLRYEQKFIDKMLEVKPDWDLSKVHYITAKKPVIVGCPTHGFYEATPENLIRFACRFCTFEGRFDAGGYANKSGYLYYLKVEIKGTDYYKVGISLKDPAERYKGQKYQNFTILYNQQIGSFVDAFRVEQRILEYYGDKRATTVTKADYGYGYTELLSEDVFGGQYDAIGDFDKNKFEEAK